MAISKSCVLTRILFTSAAVAASLATPAWAQTASYSIDISAEPMDRALHDLVRQTGANILFRPEQIRGLQAPMVHGTMSPEEAARRLTAGGKLEVLRDETGALLVRRPATDPSSDPVTIPPDPAASGEIVVTATKRAERLIDVPSAVTAISGVDLRQTQSSRFEDYLVKVPGANFLSSGEGTTQIILRGITAGSLQESSTVGIYVDEAPYGSSTAFAGGATGTPDLDTSDLARVEVLRGPQGTLYGANALGGVIKFVTAQPDTHRFSGHADVQGSTIDGGGSGYSLSGAVNVPLVSDMLAFRVSAYTRRDPGYIDDPTRDRKNTNHANVRGGRAALLFKPASNLSITLSAIAQNLSLANLSAEDVSVPDLVPILGDRTQSRLIDSPRRYHYRLYNGTLDWDLGWADFVSSTSYSTFRSAITTDSVLYRLALGGTGVRVDQPVHQTKFTQEARLQSRTGMPLEWRAGFFFTHENSLQTQSLVTFDPVTLGPARGALADFELRDRYTEYAGFGDLTWHLTDRLSLTGGARYSSNDQSFGEIQSNPALEPLINVRRSTHDDSWTWLVNPEFKVTPTLMLYGRIATGYRPGGPTLEIPGSGLPPTFKPDTLTSYEVGAKANTRDRRLSLEVDAFDIEWHNIQLNETVAGFAYITNGGDARSRGVEASIELKPTNGLKIDAGITYNDAHLTAAIPNAGGRDGDRLPGVPRWNGTIDVGYDWTLAPTWAAFLGASYRHVGNRTSDFGLVGTQAAERFALGSYDVGDLRAGLTHHGVTTTLFVKNVGDSRGVVALGPNTIQMTGQPFSAAILQPRTFGIDVSAAF